MAGEASPIASETQVRRTRLTVDLLLAVSVALLSLGALIVTVVQTKIAREQQQASVWPYLMVDRGWGDNHGSLHMVNKGIGPALIRSVKWTYRSVAYGDHREWLNEHVLTPGVKRDFSSMGRGQVLQAGEKVRLFEVRDVQDPELLKRFRAVSSDPQLTLDLVYADVYENCWRLTQDGVQKLDDCPDPSP